MKAYVANSRWNHEDCNWPALY